jgi:hypothetical protein
MVDVKRIIEMDLNAGAQPCIAGLIEILASNWLRALAHPSG